MYRIRQYDITTQKGGEARDGEIGRCVCVCFTGYQGTYSSSRCHWQLLRDWEKRNPILQQENRLVRLYNVVRNY